MTSQTENEFADFDSNTLWNEIYQRMKNEASMATLGDEYSVKQATQPENRPKNRYRDVSPYDYNRVLLSGFNDYINASLIEVEEAQRKYILTQGPLDHTQSDFWQMVWEQKSRAIIMLNRVIEKGTPKCSQYWPLGTEYGYDEEMYFPESGIRVTLLGDQDYEHFTIRTLDLEFLETGEKKEIFHFHYTTWPDFGVPSSPNAFLHFLHVVRQTGSLDLDVGPPIIHCSAGIGRSGTFCLVDSLLVLVQEKQSLEPINVRQSLIKMRSYRMGLIQTADQLRFSYLAIIQGAHAILNGVGLAGVPTLSKGHIEGPVPAPPERISSLHATINKSKGNIPVEETQPPPLPDKKGQRRFDNAPEFEESSDEELFDEPARDDDSGDSDTEDERKAAELRHRIREERKLKTMEMIQRMKEKQKKNEHWRPYKSFFTPPVYFGLALIVGLAGVVAYKYLI